MIAISSRDYNTYGCPKCNCLYGKPKGLDWSYGITCAECKTKFVVVSIWLTESPIGFKIDNSDDYIYPKVIIHPNKIRYHKYIRPDKKPKKGEYFRPRGVGYDLAGFVESKKAGERIIKLFKSVLGDNIKTWLDFREFEPDWIQVKVQKEDGINLNKLGELTANGIITKEKIMKSLIK